MTSMYDPLCSLYPDMGGPTLIEQITDFPASDATTLVVTPARAEKFVLNIRIPGWTTRDGITVDVNGKQQKTTCQEII